MNKAWDIRLHDSRGVTVFRYVASGKLPEDAATEWAKREADRRGIEHASSTAKLCVEDG